MTQGNEAEWEQSIYNPINKGKQYLSPERVNHGNVISDWKNKVLDFGTIKTRSINNGSFSYIGSKKIASVNVSCNCIAQIIIDDGRIISLTYTADEIPPHLEEMTVSKLIFVTFDNHSEDALEVKAKIIR